MMRRLLQLACLVLIGVATMPAAAQDFPMLQGSDARLGSNSDPNNSYPGQALLSWFKPVSFTSSFVRQVMASNPINTANPSGLASPAPSTNTEAEGLANGSVNVVNPTSVSGANPATSWIGYGPFNISDLAFMPYPLIPTGDATEDDYSGYAEFTAAGNDAIDYYWTESIASSTTSNTSKLNSGDSLNTFVWNIEPANSASRVAGNYALYTWIPAGPTEDPNNNTIYPQRYFVYTITDANGTYTDIVDTSLGGTGFVRLGGGGGPTNKTFAYNGTNPIVVTLYNTVPRDALGNLTEPSLNGQISPKKCVYADAILALPQQGSYYATPIVKNLSSGTTDVIQCLNSTTSGVDANGIRVNVPEGIVESDVYNTGVKIWSWSPSFVSSATITMTANSSGVTWASPWKLNPSPSGGNYKGTSYLTSTVTNDPTQQQFAIYKPALKDGTYQIEVWIPGNGNSQTYATAATFQIFEGSAETDVTVNESVQSGWVMLGTRRFTEVNASAPLVVKVSNYSANAADVNNLAFADGMLFVGDSTNISGTVAITSTPLQVNAVPITPSGGGSPVSTDVTIVADESGHIYCLDSNGDGAGGGKLLWAYPSLSSVSPDPNQVAGIDGPGPTAQMPSGFSLSSALVETIGGHPYLYIGSTNGRVYCLDMEGRGDTTTTRIWSYPDDYPSVAQTSTLGPFRGSLAFVNDGTSNGAIIVPAQQGRIYALDPLGLGNGRTTYVHWAFPFSDQSSSPFSSAGITSIAGPNNNPNDSPWNNPANAASEDSVYTTTTPDLNAYGSSPPTLASSQYLSCTQPTSFGSIPSSATILGIQVSVVRHRTAGTDNSTYIHDLSVKLTQSGTPVGIDHADTTSDWSVGTDETKLYGGQTDLWGASWTPATLQSGFGVDIAVQGNGTTAGSQTPPTAAIDFVLVRVFYQAQNPKGPILSTPAVFQPTGAAHPYVYFGCDAYPGSIPTWSATNTYTMGDLVDAADGTGLYVSLINSNVGNSPATSSSDWQSVKTPPGQFFALDSYTGQPVWEFHGTTSWSSSSTFVAADSFNSGPTIVSAANLNAQTTTATAEGWTGSTQVDTLAVANENNWITALNAGTGQVLWATNELESPVKGNLDFSPITVLDNSGSGTSATAPCVLVPTADGRFVGLFALTGSGFGSTNRLGTRRAWEYDAVGPLTASMSIGGTIGSGNGAYMYGADEYGFLYAFNQTGSSSSSGQTPPGSSAVTENNNSFVNVAAYRAAKVKIVDATTYDAARQGTLTYGGANTATSPGSAYEWGDTVYVLVYNFPYGGTSQPPIVNYQFSVAGESIRNLSVQAQRVSDPGNAPLFTDGTTVLDGYAVLPFTLQGGGSNSMAPGEATCTVSISAVSGSPARYQNVELDPTLDTVPFSVANPLGIVMRYSGGSPVANYSIGYSNLASDPQNLVNGSPDVNGHESQLTVPIGEVSHGSSGAYTFGVYDRSHMVKLRGNGIGLDNVRLQRSDLAFQGGMFAVQDPIPATPFSSFEDYPINVPNNSLDYPDIQREQVTAVKDPTGTAENPVFAGVTLTPPTLDSSGNTQMPMNATPMQMTVSVPKFQPPNETPAADSNNVGVDQGYRGQYYVFVDSYGQGQLTLDGNQREAYRSFWLGAGVQTDRRFMTTTPTVDLGSLSSGAGMSPLFDPWSTANGETTVNGTYSGMFQPFNVTNTGNVNLVNLQVLKKNATPADLGVNPTSSNSYLAWLDSYFDVRSDMDLDVPSATPGGVQRSEFALTPQVILQKARVGQVNGTTLTTNPIRQTNANLGAIQGPLYTTPSPAAPRITVQVPIGFPSGTYSQAMKIVENPGTGTPAVPNAGPSSTPGNTPAYTDPGFTLTFHVKESQLTGKPSPYVGYSNSTSSSPNLLDNYVQGTESALYGSSQPAGFRDASGNLLVAFSSSRPSWSPAAPTGASGNGNSGLYIASMLGAAPSSSGPQNMLNDLDAFSATGTNAWFKQDAGPWPSATTLAQANTLFVDSGLTGYNVAVNSTGVPIVNFTSPSFPTGPNNPLTGATNGPSTYMVFLGNAQVNSGQSLTNESRVFITPVTINNDGSATMSTTIVPLPDDLDPSAGPQLSGVTKQRPTILQFGSNATVFYSTSGAGHGQIFCATFDGTKWTSNAPIALPNNFDFVGSPSAFARMQGSTGLIELSFAAKVAGRAHPDIYFAELQCGSTGVPASLTLQDLVPVTGESLAAGQNGVYQAAGLDWDTTNLPLLTLGTTNITGTPQVDPTTGVLSYDDPVLGGKIYVDPRAGTVQFANATVPTTMLVKLNYTPRLLRVSSGNTSATSPTLLFDHRYLGDLSGWYTQNGTAVTDGDPTTGPYADRFVFLYGANSTGTGQAARAYISTYRFGVQLPLPIATNSSGGTPQSITVSGNNGDYQLDPANGRIYFTTADEGNNAIGVTYTALNPDGTTQNLALSAQTAGLIEERAEAPLPVEQAVNESQLGAFLDPFNFAGPYQTAANLPATPARPGLIWLFWTSTRNGSPDIYFETIAPNFSPLVSK